ncbi:fructokinase [Haloechinothrix alba]|uniref:Fructokinase n=1 Tax=Haloechinothrix alba TaxID=664784 RepID=A0A238VPS1_9PSEU|nr:carbohydrate kinase [Haloechinothrix alba]SNR36208.1 fructokinase [Haloechinothrix alba]
MITVVGEALLDLVSNGERDVFTAHPGGSPANTAVGLARLGLPVTLATQLGDDLAGRLVREHLGSSGVALQLLPSPAPQTSLALAAVDDDGGATYDFRLSWDVAGIPRLPPECVCVHTGSLAAARPPGYAAIDELLRTYGPSREISVSFDPNIRPSLIGSREDERRRMERQVPHCDIVKVSAEDLHWLHPGQEAAAIARRWLSWGPALVIVTLGADGAWALNHAADTRVGSIPATVIDTVGAGDAFSAGLLAALHSTGLLGVGSHGLLAAMDEGALRSAVTHAARVAALTCSRAGADPPTRQELENWHSRT